MQGRILIVEPDDAIREMLRAALRRTGHDVAAMDTGDEAIAAMEREHFSCVLVGSPVTVESNGARLLFLEYIERHCPRWRPCIIVVTTHVEPGPVIATVERLAVCAVLAKPFAAADVVGGLSRRPPHAHAVDRRPGDLALSGRGEAECRST